MDIRILLQSQGIHCRPIECGQGARAVLYLKSGLEGRSRDGSGVLLATIAHAALIGNIGGLGQWDYQFTVDPGEIAVGESVAPADVGSVCCLGCDAEAAIRKIRQVQTTDFTIESFRVFGPTDIVSAGEVKLFRRHTAIQITAMEVSVDSFETGYPYSTMPATLEVRPIITSAQTSSPWIETGGAAIINPASSTPLTARYVFPTPLEVGGGSAFGANLYLEPSGNFRGLEVHLELNIPKT